MLILATAIVQENHSYSVHTAEILLFLEQWFVDDILPGTEQG